MSLKKFCRFKKSNLFKIKTNFNCFLCSIICKSVFEKIQFIDIKVKICLKMNSFSTVV